MKRLWTPQVKAALVALIVALAAAIVDAATGVLGGV